MKKIVPFNNVLTFDTDVYEIIAISLEHEINKNEDAISGVFHITGEYKITVGSLEKDAFSFACSYDLNTLIVDIDDFKYELLDNNRLKVNIDLYIDGEVKEETDDLFTEEEIRDMEENIIDEPTSVDINEDIDLLGDMLDDKKKETKDDINVQNSNINIFNGFNEEEKYVTYHVYPVTENDTLDKIMEKYHVTKEELSKYNGNLDIRVGDKLIIPSINNDK